MIALLVAACGEPSPSTAAPDAAVADAAAPADAGPGPVRVTEWRVDDHFGGGQTVAPHVWSAGAQLQVISLADPGRPYLPTRFEGATAVFDDVPAGPYLFVFRRLRYQMAYFREREVSITFATFSSDATWPEDAAELEAVVTFPSTTSRGNLRIYSTADTDIYDDGAFCLPGDALTRSCVSAPPYPVPWGGGARMLVTLRNSNPLRYFLADPLYDPALKKVTLAGTLTAEPRQPWSVDLRLAALGAAAAAADPRCTATVTEGMVGLIGYPRAVGSEVEPSSLVAAQQMVSGGADVVATADAVLPPGFDSYEVASLRLGACELRQVRRGGDPYVPTIGVPRNVRVNGVAITDTVSGVGPTPTITWDPPAEGTPTEYRLLVGGEFGSEIILPPDVRSFTVPVDAMGVGGLARVAAYAGGIDGRTRRTQAVPEAWAGTRFDLFP